MLEPPPRRLVELLGDLGLAGELHVLDAARRVRRLCRGLPAFESVWVDALAQNRVLSQFQAAEINAGRGPALAVGPYVLVQPIAGPAYIQSYLATHRQTREIVRLAIGRTAVSPGAIERLNRLVADADRLLHTGLSPATGVGKHGSVFWIASPWLEGATAAELLVHHGRFEPSNVQALAGEMLVALAHLDKYHQPHGDVSAQSLIVRPDGRAVLLLPGVRPILRAVEDYSTADLAPEAFDYLAPERVADAAPCSLAADLYGCGCVWWHLLAGRTPLAGGNALGKMRAAQQAEIPSVHHHAPAIGGTLAETLTECLRRDPSERPASIARVATRFQQFQSAREVSGWSYPALPRQWRPVGSRFAVRASWAAVAAALLLGVGVVAQSARQHRQPDVATINAPPRILPATVAAAPKLPAASPSSVQPTSLIEPARAAISTDGPIDWARLQPGQTLRPASGRRTVRIDESPVTLAATNLLIEDFDFVVTKPTNKAAAAMLRARSGAVEFRRCTFRGQPGWTAIDCASSAEAGDADRGSRLTFRDCWFRGWNSIARTGAARLELNNVLVAESESLVHRPDMGSLSQPLAILLTRVTLRDTGPLADLAGVPPEEGRFVLRTEQSVLAPRPEAALIVFRSHVHDEAAWASLRWTGNGSLVSPEAALAAWQTADGASQPLDDTTAAISGLVRSQIDFAGRIANGPAASRAVRWLAPLPSADPPGCDCDALPPGQSW